jgi:formylglycine-generating enzyme required for sulfatase activity
MSRRSFLHLVAPPALAFGLALPLLLAQQPAGRKYAFLVGVNEYQHERLRPLSYAEADVHALAKVLGPAGYQVTLLTGAADDAALRPTRENIEKQLKAVLGRCRKGDTVLMAFAGHGLQFEGDKDAYFCPLDARPFKDRKDSLVSLARLYRELDQSFAGMKVLLVDACRDDPDVGRGSRGVTADSAPRPPQGVAALFSCRAGERAYEHEKLGHGVYFYHVLQGLKGKARDADGEVTFAGLAAYVSRRVARQVPDLIGGGAKQSPNLKADYSTEPVLIGAEVERVAAETPPPARAPFDERKAKELQQVWAKYLGRKVEETIAVGDGVRLEFVLIPPGHFTMGSPRGEAGRRDDEPEHEVTITRPFYLGKCHVTRGQFQRFVRATNYVTEAEKDDLGGWGYVGGRDPLKGPKFDQETGKPSGGYRTKCSWKRTGFTQTDGHPVVNVSWNDAQAFCTWLAKIGGRPLRLPTEAEWEYACRAGTQSCYHFGNDGEELARYANVADRTAKKLFPTFTTIAAADGHVFTSPVRSFRPNGFGLFDMHGNVLQWCADWYGPYDGLGARDPLREEKVSENSKVVRGGSWISPAVYCRAAGRMGFGPSVRHVMLGFRVAFRVD